MVLRRSVGGLAVAELEEAESELRRSEERYRVLAENAWDVVWTMSLDGSITYVSPSIERVRGLTAQEAMAQRPDQINPPASAAVVADYFDRLFTAIKQDSRPPEFRGELEYYRKDGSIMIGELQVIPRCSAGGSVVEIVGVTRDISERKRCEAAEARYRRLIDTSVVATNLIAADGRVILVNDAMCHLVGYDAATLVTMTWRDLTVPEDPASDVDAIADLLAGRHDSWRTTRRYTHADGHLIWGDESLSCLRNQDGAPEYVAIQIIDITEEVQAQHQLAEQVQRNRDLAERLRAELDSAARYVTSILPGEMSGSVQVSYRYLPPQEIGGDCFGYTWLDDDNLIFYLIDVSGHGVEPALVSVSAHNLLRSGLLRSEILVTPDEVLTELNQLFEMERHGGNYLTIWFGTYRASTRILRYAGAGHPPAAAFVGGSPTLLASQAPPVGMFGDTVFTTSVFAVPHGCQLLLYTDGALESPTADGTERSLTDFLNLCTGLAERPDWSLDELLDRLQNPSRSGVFEPACALIRLCFD